MALSFVQAEDDFTLINESELIIRLAVLDWQSSRLSASSISPVAGVFPEDTAEHHQN
jgi:hypothetical protein